MSMAYYQVSNINQTSNLQNWHIVLGVAIMVAVWLWLIWSDK